MFETKAKDAGQSSKVANDAQGADPLARSGPADALADSLSAGPIFRKDVAAAPSANPNEAFSSATGGAGSAIPFRSDMESSFGQDFSGVSSHTAQSGAMGKLGAEAATQGETVAFRDSSPSKETVAHELTHVMQNRNGGASGSGLAAANSSAEREADATASAVANGSAGAVSGGPSGAIHLRNVGTKHISDRLTLADFQTKTAHGRSKRGKNLSRIDGFLAIADAATAPQDVSNALNDVRGAANSWLAKHPEGKGNASIQARRPHVDRLVRRLDRYVPAPGGTPADKQLPAPAAEAALASLAPPAITEWKTADGASLAASDGTEGPSGTGYQEDGSGQKIMAAIGSDIIPKALGMPSAVGGTKPTATTPASAIADNNRFGIAGGTGAAIGGVTEGIGGVMDIMNADTGYKKAKGVGKTASGAGKLAGGTAKIVASAQGLAGNKAGQAISTSVSDGIMGGTSVLGAVMDGADFVEGLTHAKDIPGMSVEQRLSWFIARGKNLIGVAKGSADAVNGITTAATGAASTAAKTTGGALGVATGSIDVLHGGYMAVSGGVRKGKLTHATKTADGAKAGVETLLSMSDELLADAAAKHEVYRETAENSTNVRRKAFYTDKRKTMSVRVEQFKATIADLTAKQAELASIQSESKPVMEAMRKVQNNRMKEGGFKAATGTLDVVAGALMLSGIGAPIALGIGVFNGLLKLGKVGLQFGRKRKANKLMSLASRLTDSGAAKGEADDTKPDYRSAERRLNNSYYKHYSNAIEDKAPSGLSGADWMNVRDFVQERKNNKIKLSDQHDWGTKGDADGAPASDKAANWGKYTDGSKVRNEKPGKLRRLDLLTTFSAHKSEQAQDASNGELADGAVRIAMRSFDPSTKTFVSTQVNANDPAQGVRATNARALLDNVGVNTQIWTKMWRNAGGHFSGDKDPAHPTTPYTSPKGPDPGALIGDMKKKINGLT
jgi:hypothetical protein